MYAVVKTGGKQLKVSIGQLIDVEKLPVEEGASVRLDQVLLAANDGTIAHGRPTIDGAVVTAQVKRQYRGPKLTVFKYKSKSRYRRKTGHRQSLTQLSIEAIEIPGWETARRAAQEAPADESAPRKRTGRRGAGVAEAESAGSAAPTNDVIQAVDVVASPEPVVEPAADSPVPESMVGEPTTLDEQEGEA